MSDPSKPDSAQPRSASGQPILERLDLLSCVVERSTQPLSPRRYSVGLTEFSRCLSEDRARLNIVAGFDAMVGIDRPACKLQASYQLMYRAWEGAPDGWADSIKDHVALAHIVPYYRELVSSMTSRLGIGTLIIQPLNTASLLKKLHGTPPPADL